MSNKIKHAALSGAGDTDPARASDQGVKPTDAAPKAQPAGSNGKPLAALRSRTPVAFSDSTVEVDEANGVIKNAAVMTVGDALGHGFNIDALSLQQLTDLINASPDGLGVKSRFTHPETDDEGIQKDDLPTKVGRVRNLRIVGNSARGDVYIGEYAAILPGLGDVRSYLLKLAKEDPAQLGLSAVIAYETEPVTDAIGNVISNPARILAVDAVDFVGKAAANPNGLLSAISPALDLSRGLSMNDQLKRILYELGLPYDASDEAAQAFLEALTVEMRTEIQSRLKAIAAATKTDMDKAIKAAAEAVAATSSMSARTIAKALLAAKDSTPKQVTKQPGSAPAASTTTLISKGKSMDEMLKAILLGAGCKADATDDEAQEFYDGLAAEKKADIDAKALSAKSAKDGANLRARQQQQQQAALSDADAEFVKSEEKRAGNIKLIAAAIKTGDANVDKAIDTAALAAIGEGLTVVQARQKVCAALSANLKPIAPGGASIQIGEDSNVASLQAAIPQAIMLRANADLDVKKFEEFEKREAIDQMVPGKKYLGKLHERALTLRRMTVLDMYKTYLRAVGVDVPEGISRVALANLLGPRNLRSAYPKVAALAESTSDFASITLDAINKSLRFMYLDAPRTWNKWAQRQTNSDFKNINRVVLSEAPSMIAGVEGKEVNYVAMSDSKETYSLTEYKSGIKLTRRAIINDDLDAFSQIPRAQANSAARLEEDVAYAVLTNNAAMADTGLLFNSTAVTTAGGHANLAGSGTAISISSLQAGWAAIQTQKGLAGAAFLELQPKFLLVPTDIYFPARQLLMSDKIVAAQASGSATPITLGEANPFQGLLEVIGSTRLHANSTTAWYLMSDYRDGQINTIEVCFLTDEPEPVVRQETDFDTEDVKYLVRHTCAAKAIDPRGMYKNPGA